MSFWKTGIRPLCAALMLLCAGSVYAASHQAALQSDDYVAVERKKRYSETEYAEEYTRRQDIVQRANMAKLWPDGKPHYNPKDGKVIKPAGWEDPEPKIRAYIDSVIAAKGGGQAR